MDRPEQLERDASVLGELPVRPIDRRRQFPSRRVEEVERQLPGLRGRQDRLDGEPGRLPHGEQGHDVRVAFPEGRSRTQRTELDQSVDVADVDAGARSDLRGRKRVVGCHGPIMPRRTQSYDAAP
ncbi:MAG: hypothetical protein ACRELC_10630 [Gemmatimonadota bacterium]